MRKAYVAYVLSWTESEAGWGRRPDGYSLHESQAEVKAYIDAYWAEEKARNPSGAVPGCYSRPDGSTGRLTIVTQKAAKALRTATEAGNHGIRQWHSTDFTPKK